MNYQSVCRTSYFEVKNSGSFIEECRALGLGVSKNDAGFMVHSWDNVGDDEHPEFEIGEFIAGRIHPEHCAILQYVGFEGLRYIAGYSAIVTANGIQDYTHLPKMEEQAEKTGLLFTACEY